MDVDVGVGVPHSPARSACEPRAVQFQDRRHQSFTRHTAFAPLVLGWNAGNFHWNIGVFGFAPTGGYRTKQLANTSLNHWAVMYRLAATYYDPKSGWQVNGAAIYSVNWENPGTDYETGNILNFDGAHRQEFRADGGSGPSATP